MTILRGPEWDGIAQRRILHGVAVVANSLDDFASFVGEMQLGTQGLLDIYLKRQFKGSFRF